MPARTQDGVAISATGRRWYLLNASPAIRTQILGSPLMAPGPSLRDTPIQGSLLTDAELDHVTFAAIATTAPFLRGRSADEEFHFGLTLLLIGLDQIHSRSTGPE